jgi:hypothetical protein
MINEFQRIFKTNIWKNPCGKTHGKKPLWKKPLWKKPLWKKDAEIWRGFDLKAVRANLDRKYFKGNKAPFILVKLRVKFQGMTLGEIPGEAQRKPRGDLEENQGMN